MPLLTTEHDAFAHEVIGRVLRRAVEVRLDLDDELACRIARRVGEVFGGASA